MKRRQFLTLGATGGGACFFAEHLFRRFEDYANNHGKPLLEDLPKSGSTRLFVDKSSQVLCLGSRQWDCEPERLTWEEYLTNLGYGIRTEEDWLRIYEEYELAPPRKFKRLRKNLFDFDEKDFEPANLSDEVSDDVHESYVENDWVRSSSPEASAYYFLEKLEIGNLSPNPLSGSVGELTFYDAPHPCSNALYAELEGGEVAASCLQRRLNELVGDVEVIYD
jgi:hypothetical protein